MDQYIPKFMKYKYKPENRSTHSTEFSKSILKELVQKKGFTNPKVIEENKFSATIIVDNSTNEKMAVKIIQDDDLAEKEKQWQNLHHHHVLPLSSYEYFNDAKVHLFYSNLPFSTLKDILAEKGFKKSPDAIKELIMWFKQAAAAMQYIHKSGYQHMNISSKCIAITKDEAVKIKDFGYLQYGGENNNRYGVNSHFCPPETYSQTGSSETGYGKKFDTYCFGIMMLEALTGCYIEKKLKGVRLDSVKSWNKEAYPVLFKALRGHKFKKLVSKQYPKAATNTDLTNLRRLIASILRFNPGDRPNMKEVFLNLFELSFLKDFLVKPLEDEIWQDMVSYKELKYKIDEMTLQNEHAVIKEYICDSNDVILTEANDIDLKIADTHHCSQSLLNRKQKDVFVEATDEIVVDKPRNEITDVTCSEDREKRKSDYLISDIRKVNIDKGMMGDHAKETNSKESVALNFEHEDLSVLEISSTETVIADNTKTQDEKLENPAPFDEREEKNCSFIAKDEKTFHTEVNENIFKQYSEVLEHKQQSKDADLIEKDEYVKSYENSKQDKQQKTDSTEEKSKAIYSVKKIFTKAFKWILDEHLYSGVMNTDSYINKLSEALTD